MNKVILIGNLASDPEAFTTQSGVSRSTFRIAVQRRFANAQGVREADFFTIVAWRQTADDGSKRYVTEIMADSVEALGGRDEGQARPRDNGPTPPPAPPAGPAMNDFTEVEDDELPF